MRRIVPIPVAAVTLAALVTYLAAASEHVVERPPRSRNQVSPETMTRTDLRGPRSGKSRRYSSNFRQRIAIKSYGGNRSSFPDGAVITALLEVQIIQKREDDECLTTMDSS